jgi:dihydrofolate reductase
LLLLPTSCIIKKQPDKPVEMRKLIVSMNLSLDGFMSGVHDELDWHAECWSEEMGEKLLELLDNADTLLLGRITYEAMAGYWPYKPLDQNFPRQDQAIADQMNRHEKIVFSRSHAVVFWRNTKMARHNYVDEIRLLRQRPGKNMLIFGSRTLVSSCMKSGLVDEYHLWIHPVLLGKGIPLFRLQEQKINLKLSGSEILDPGVALLRYEVIP